MRPWYDARAHRGPDGVCSRCGTLERRTRDYVYTLGLEELVIIAETLAPVR
jgi:hypothetical protein